MSSTGEISKRLKLDRGKLEQITLRELVARGCRFYEQGHLAEAEECFRKAEKSVDIQSSDGPNKDLPQLILYHLFFLKLRSRTPFAEDALTSECTELIREYGPPPFSHQVFLMASLISLGYYTAISNIIKDLTYSKGPLCSLLLL